MKTIQQNIPEGCKWVLHSYATPTGISRVNNMKFEDFESRVYKWRAGNFHLFELRSKQINIMAFCLIDLK